MNAIPLFYVGAGGSVRPLSTLPGQVRQALIRVVRDWLKDATTEHQVLISASGAITERKGAVCFGAEQRGEFSFTLIFSNNVPTICQRHCQHVQSAVMHELLKRKGISHDQIVTRFSGVPDSD